MQYFDVIFTYVNFIFCNFKILPCLVSTQSKIVQLEELYLPRRFFFLGTEIVYLDEHFLYQIRESIEKLMERQNSLKLFSQNTFPAAVIFFRYSMLRRIA